MRKRSHYDFSQEILRRKYLLIREDRLAKELDYALAQFFGKEKDAKRMGISFKSGYPKEIKEALEKIESIEMKIQKKWGCIVYIPEVVWAGQVHQCLWGVSGSTPKIERANPYVDFTCWSDEKGIDRIFFFQTKVKPVTAEAEFYYLGSPDDLLIRVNTSLIDLNDAAELKEKFWNIVEDELKRKKQALQQEKEVLDETDALHDLYHMRPDTFDRCLRWYDLHTIGRWSFRKIALLEISKDKDAQMEQLRGKEPVGPIKGESNVRKGVKRIYRLIHRQHYQKPAGKLEEYNCPEHGRHCPEDCPSIRKFQEDFDRIQPPEISFLPRKPLIRKHDGRFVSIEEIVK